MYFLYIASASDSFFSKLALEKEKFLVNESTCFQLPNAQLRGEQRYHPNLTHCAINTKLEVEPKMPSVGNPS
ncbi:hypothetical protein DC889_24610 [Vibrio parahaemolyticus]|nr:hypothetical protein [Vibrio parahaemolyticus]